MRLVPRLRWLAKPSARIAGTSVLALATIALASPADGATSGLVARIASAVRLSPGAAHQGTTFPGTAAVGTLVTVSDGTVGNHFCTASVVHSPHGNLLITAAHCVTGQSGTIAFVPGYDNAKTPYGIWYVSRVFVDQAWSTSSSVDDDVAFLQVDADSAGMQIEAVTGGERLGLNEAAGQLTDVIGYPEGSNSPVACDNQTTAFTVPSTGTTQLEFDCGGYPDGTSGGPFLTQVNKTTGLGTVTGVIGGYEQGGYTPSVSYSAPFGSSVSALYQTAVAASS
jgi:V8-like Glu-specific endopeptidase